MDNSKRARQDAALIRQLFEGAGNTMHESAHGWRCGHEPVHNSSSGTCVSISQELGVWTCHSCKNPHDPDRQLGGGPIEAWLSLKGSSDRKAAVVALRDGYGYEPPISEKHRPVIHAAVDRLAREYPALQFPVAEIMPEGLLVFAGPPKVGKSTLVRAIAVAIAGDASALGRYPVEAGPVLYFALEDSERRMKAKLQALLADRPCPPDLHVSFTLPTVPEGGVAMLEDAIRKHMPKAVFLDTWGRFAGKVQQNTNVYEHDYSRLAQLHRVALDAHCTLGVVTHTRKAAADDFMNQVSGSSGITGAADTVWVLQRARLATQAVLNITGRDIEEQALALEWNTVTGGWTVLGGAEEVMETEDRVKLFALLREHGPMSIAQIADTLGRDKKLTTTWLWKVRQAGLLEFANGKYDRVKKEGGYIEETLETSKDSESSEAASVNPVTVSEISNASEVSMSSKASIEVAAPEGFQDSEIPKVSKVSTPYPTPAFQLVTEPADLERELPHFLSAPVVGLDTETTGLDPRVDRLRLIQLATPDRVLVVDLDKVPIAQLAPPVRRGPEAGPPERCVRFGLSHARRDRPADRLPAVRHDAGGAAARGRDTGRGAAAVWTRQVGRALPGCRAAEGTATHEVVG